MTNSRTVSAASEEHETRLHAPAMRVDSISDIDALFQNESILEWLDEKLDEADGESGVTYGAEDMRSFLDRAFAEARSRNGS